MARFQSFIVTDIQPDVYDSLAFGAPVKCRMHIFRAVYLFFYKGDMYLIDAGQTRTFSTLSNLISDREPLSSST